MHRLDKQDILHMTTKKRACALRKSGIPDLFPYSQFSNACSILNKVKTRSRFLALWYIIMIITFIIILHVKDYSITAVSYRGALFSKAIFFFLKKKLVIKRNRSSVSFKKLSDKFVSLPALLQMSQEKLNQHFLNVLLQEPLKKNINSSNNITLTRGRQLRDILSRTVIVGLEYL